MHPKSTPGFIFLALTLAAMLSACTRKGSFIDEGVTGTGQHYYPVLLSDGLADTVTHKGLNLTDTTFSRGQQLIFELDFYSQDPVDSLEVWAGKKNSELRKSVALGPSAIGFSISKIADTVLFHYTIPSEADSSNWYIAPRIVTTAGLQVDLQAVIRVR